jgi:cell division protein FtsB
LGTREKILFTVALALALGLAGYGLLGPGSGKRAQLAAELERLQRENRELAAENRRLALEVEALQHRRDYQEKVIREELGLLRPDEVIIQLSENTDGGQPDAAR